MKVFTIKLSCLLFTILHPFGTRESIRRKVDHGGLSKNLVCEILPKIQKIKKIENEIFLKVFNSQK
jgi:hypothetical protein